MLELNKIHQGDCLELMQSIDDKSIDMILTDIPYGKPPVVEGKLRKLGFLAKKGANEINFEITKLLDELVRVTKNCFYIFCGKEQFSEIYKHFADLSLPTRAIVWEKTNPFPLNADKLYLSGVEICVYSKFHKSTFNAYCKNTVFRNANGGSKYHPTQKPIKLFKEFIMDGSSENDIILDPFMGSGTTAIACMQTNRNFIGMELEPKYVEIANNRIKEFKQQLTII